ncbi:MAG: AmiS/UreI family transporter [Bacillota bacterium]
MLGVVLFFVGAVLLVDGAMLLGKANAKSAAVFNVLVGGLIFLGSIITMVQAGGEMGNFFLAAAMLLFGLTYLYLGAIYLLNYEADGFGWYCLFVAVSAAVNSYFAFPGDLRLGLMWLAWAILWFMFFLLTALKKNILKLSAYSTLIVAVVTCWLPGYLILTGRW